MANGTSKTANESWQTNLFYAFYFSFILRDVFGKIVPGMILIISIVLTFNPTLEIFNKVLTMSLWPWIGIFGVGWLSGFVVQGIGEIISLGPLKFYRYHTREYSNPEFLVTKFKFEQKATMEQKLQYQRFVVIKEACGNGYLALFLSILIWSIGKFVPDKLTIFSINFNHLFIFTMVAVAIISLFFMHHQYVKRQDHQLKETLK